MRHGLLAFILAHAGAGSDRTKVQLLCCAGPPS